MNLSFNRYDFDMRTGQSDTGLRACVYKVEVRKSLSEDIETVWVETPDETKSWRLVEFRPVSEGDS